MSPLLRSLTGTSRSLADVADALERHIGDGTDEGRCREAVQVLARIRTHNPSYYLRAAMRELDRELAPCEVIRRVIRVLRKWRHYSGT